MPGINHIILTITDIERSRRFYRDLLGFELHEWVSPKGTVFTYFMAGEASIWFRLHEQTPPGDRFSEFRVGMDHLAFSAPDEAFLHTMADKLIAAGVTTQGVEQFVGRWWYVAFRDPDNIQLEYWLDEPHAG